jgi:hypothetical protein
MEGGEVSFTSNTTLPAIERIVTAKYRRGAEFNRQRPFVDVLLSGIHST